MESLKKVLIVEDSPINRAMLCGILSAEYEVLEAENGQDALTVLRQYGEQISLILLDIIMPVMDGYTFLSVIKADSCYSSIPVIVTTQSDGETDEVTALSHGAADFVAKPYKPKIILHRVASIIHLRETAAIVNLLQYDRLTGLYSKEFFYQRVKELLQQHPDRQYDMICSDIENFKLVNDVFGVPAGDQLLCNVATLYRDEVWMRGICGRLNADQFVCVIEHRDDYVDEMFTHVSEKLKAMSTVKNVVIKWGIYTIDHAISVEQMCDRALLAVRSIKGQYGKYFAVYDEKLRNELIREQEITDSMESALADGQFEIYFQPKYRIADNSLAGAEVLVRWNHPEYGVQLPGQFIPLFERNGFIIKLDKFVWDRACAVLREWDDKGYRPISVSVNVSRADIYHEDLAQVLTNTVQKYGLEPSRLHLEITESAYTEDPNQIIETAKHLRELGFIVEMDDFGSGYSSLNMLNQLPLDILKLDMKFIQSETAKPKNQGILRFIMGLARSMGLDVVAEGVETREQLERLREYGCDYVQGYYFAKPMPCHDFAILIQNPENLIQQEGHSAYPQHPSRVLLIADEDEVYRRELRAALEETYQVVEATDGNSVLSSLMQYRSEVAVVLLSLTLCEPDGFSVLQMVQKEKTVWNIPIIATGPADKQTEEHALALGAEDFCCKPHSYKSIVWRINKVIQTYELQQREQVFQEEARRDFLTGLLNRRGLFRASQALQWGSTPFVVYLFDLDNLKQINDTMGHIQGDRFLRDFSTILRSCAKGADILARYGGDEFILIGQSPSEEIALQKGREICQALQAKKAAACSAGIAFWYMDEPLEKVIEKADKALYRAKMENKGGCGL